jgi:hypothetical protein
MKITSYKQSIYIFKEGMSFLSEHFTFILSIHTYNEKVNIHTSFKVKHKIEFN